MSIDPPECYFHGAYQESKVECSDCKFAERCKKTRQKVRSELAKRIKNSGLLSWFRGFFIALGDHLVSHPEQIEERLIMYFTAYHIAYGATERGLTGLANPEIHKMVVEAEADLNTYLYAMKNWYLSRDEPEYDILVKKPLRKLEKKYSKKLKSVNLDENPTELLNLMIQNISLQFLPEVLSTIAIVTSLLVEVSNISSESHQESITRFRELSGEKKGD